MTASQFQHWSKNGNLKLGTQEEYDSLANDLAENIEIPPEKLLELAKYLQLCLIEENNRFQMLKLDVLKFSTTAIELQNKY